MTPLLLLWVRATLEDDNVKATVRIISSEEKPALDDAVTLNSLRQRHPPAPPDRRQVPEPSTCAAVQVIETDVIKAIRSFPAGSSAGLTVFDHNTFWT